MNNQLEESEDVFEESIFPPSELEINWNSILTYILVKIQGMLEGTEDHPETRDIKQEASEVISNFLSYLTNMDVERTSEPPILYFSFIQNLQASLNFEPEVTFFKEMISKALSFSKLFIPFIQDLCNVYPAWIENHTITNDERDKHKTIIAILMRLKDNLINVGSTSNHILGLFYLQATITEMVEKIFKIGVWPPVELLRTTMVEYPELHQFMEEAVLKTIEPPAE